MIRVIIEKGVIYNRKRTIPFPSLKSFLKKLKEKE